jgi:hypothetical protein
MSRSQIASDAFTYSNGNIESVSGGNWTSLNPNWGGAAITSNHVGGAFSDEETPARWTGAGTFANDQYSSLLIPASSLSFNGSSYSVGVIARASADIDGARDYYTFYVVDDASGDPASRTTVLAKVVDGTPTTLHSASVSWGSGMRIEIECEGTTIRGMKDGVLVSGFEITDSALSAGKPGIWLRGSVDFPKGDDWQGGDITAITNATGLPVGVSAAAAIGSPTVAARPPPPYTLTRVTG